MKVRRGGLVKKPQARKSQFLNVLIGILKYTYFMYRLKQANKSYSNIWFFPIQIVSLQDFSIDAFINFKSNILYSFGKE